MSLIRTTRTGHPCEGTVHAENLPPSVDLARAADDGWVIETLTDLPVDLSLPGDAVRLLEAVRAAGLPWTLTQRPPRGGGRGIETIIDVHDIDPAGGWSIPWKDWAWGTDGSLRSEVIPLWRAHELLAERAA